MIKKVIKEEDFLELEDIEEVLRIMGYYLETYGDYKIAG